MNKSFVNTDVMCTVNNPIPREMRAFNLIFLLILFSISGSNSYAQLDSAVKYLSDRYSKYQYFIKIPGEKNFIKTGNLRKDSVSFEYYKKTDIYYYDLIDSFASNEDLIKLTGQKSPIIQCYAAYALGKRDTLLLPEVLKKMMDDPVYAVCSNTDFAFERVSASMIFTSLSQRKRLTGYPTDDFMDSMYSIFLLHKNTPGDEIGMALVYHASEKLKPTIEKLAFERKNIDAMRYMNKWHKSEYYTLLNKNYLELLDSNIVQYSIPVNEEIIRNLIDLRDKETLRKLGIWLKNTRDKWVGIYGIDNLLDNCWEILDSVKRGQERYPFSDHDIKFLLGEWIIISGMDINDLATKDTIVLERKMNQKGEYQKLKYDVSVNSLYSYYYESTNVKKVKMVGTPIYDTMKNRICLRQWDWYKIIIEKDKLTLIREKP